MRIFGRGEETAGDMEFANDIEEKYKKEPCKPEEHIECRTCAGNMEIVDDIIQREKEEQEKKQIDKRLTSPIKRATGGG